MNKILFLDATVRAESRTKSLAEYLIEKLDGDVEHIALKDGEIPTLDNKLLEFRCYCCKTGNFDSEYFDYAKQFAGADIIVIAAPFWDHSFPAVLKKYIETISVSGITFKYDENGVPRGLCRAKKLFYITTAGGKILDDAFGYGYIKGLATGMYGIRETYEFKAEGLDIWGADVEKILEKTKNEIKNALA